MFVTWVLVWKVHIREAGFQWIQYWSLVHRRGESDQLRSMMNWTSERGQMAMRQSLKEWLQWGSTAPEFYEKLLEYSMSIICNYSSTVPKTLQQEAVQYICRLDVFRPLMSRVCLHFMEILRSLPNGSWQRPEAMHHSTACISWGPIASWIAPEFWSMDVAPNSPSMGESPPCAHVRRNKASRKIKMATVTSQRTTTSIWDWTSKISHRSRIWLIPFLYFVVSLANLLAHLPTLVQNRFLLRDDPCSEGMVGGCVGNPGSGSALENLEILRFIVSKARKARTVVMPLPVSKLDYSAILTIFGSLLQRAQKP